MKSINRYRLMFLFLVSSLSLSVISCKKYLDQQPISAVGPQMVFSDVNTTLQALAGVYSRMIGDAAYGIRLSLYYTVDNDETQGPTGNTDNDRRDIARYSVTPTNAQLNAPFNQIFQGIEYANICIDQIPKMTMYASGSDQQKKQLRRMLGEALTLRAQFYFEAIKHWGDVPSHFKPAYAQAAENPFPLRVSRDSIYNVLLDDLKTASDLLPWRNEVTSIGDQLDERITKGTAKALRARIALFRGGFALRQNGTMQRNADYLTYYQIAKTECSEIISSGQHSLNPSYKSLWKDQVCAHAVTDPNGELMFQVSAIGNTGVADSKLGYYNGPTVNGFGNKSINILPTYFYLFDSTDLRRDVTCCVYNVNADGVTKTGQAITAINDGKYRRDWMTNPTISPTSQVQYFSLKWQLIRYSDVLLMLAEAENELNGPTTIAYNAINQVRRRGYGKSITAADPTVDLTAGLSKTQFFDAIVKERSLEFGGEGIRKFDLIRWNLLAQKIADTKTALTAMSTVSAPYSNLPIAMYFRANGTSDDNTFGNFAVNSFYRPAPTSTPTGTTKVSWLTSTIAATALSRYASSFTTGKSELLPLPQQARDANFNLTQNPGY